jgi:epoxyqueuosine reductase QueG
MDTLRDSLLAKGADLVGYADLGALPADVREQMPFGVAIAVALDPGIVAGIEAGPTREYYAEYNRANDRLGTLAEAAAASLREQGHHAIPRAATNVGIEPATLSTRLPHKTVATRAGLGWIGKCALLVTEQFGSAVRLTSVLTDAELPAAEAVEGSRCEDCVACVDVCPGRAPSGGDWRPGRPRDAFFNAHACREAARRQAAKSGIDDTVCGLCIAACPWTRRYTKAARRQPGE